MPGARCARGLVCNNSGRCAHEHTGHTGITRHSPRNGLRLISCSPRRPGFFATVIRAPERELDTSVGVSGPHDFARPHQARSSVAPSASTAARPANVTIAYRPFGGTGWMRISTDLLFL